MISIPRKWTGGGLECVRLMGGGSTNGVMMSRIEENEMRSRSGCRTKI